MSRPVKDIVIVGGGTAGWMTAAALSRTIDLNSIRVRLVESDSIGTVGVGEATIPNIIGFNRMLGIDEPTFMRETAATIKYGIEFVDWTKDGDRYFHPFGTHGVDLDGLSFHHHWSRAQTKGQASRIEDYCLTAQAALSGKAASPSRDPNNPLSMLSHAYQFDAALYAAFLRRYAETRGLERVEGKVVSVNLAPETGFITSLDLDDGGTLKADLFIDCSGFRALLLGQALEVSYESWADLLPVDRAVTAQTSKSGPVKPFTRCTAKQAGWQWRIPLQHRTGNGYVYSSRFIDDDTAKDEFLSGLESDPITSLKQIRFTTGRRTAFWEKNCIGIGLSSGFLEPLESTSIYLIQTGIKALVSLFPDATCPQIERDEYNKILGREYQQIRDFLVLHYVANERTGRPFWDYLRDMPIPNSLTQKIDLFRERGRFFRYDGDLFSETSWVAVFLGQGIIPKGYNPVADTMPMSDLTQRMDMLRKGIAQTTDKLPAHDEFLARYGAAMSERQR